ncbi:MAG: T9SS type A sorting domain-containing protein [Fluviicola sp.]
MKKFLLFNLLILSVSNIFSQCIPTASADVTIPCNGSTTLTAQTNATNFLLSQAACTPYPCGATAAFPVACDDCVTGQIPIGFSFNFLGNTYTNAVISSNGLVGFGAFTFAGFTPFTIPAGGSPNNYIAGFMCDIDIRYGGTITYQQQGTAPNRRFVVCYNNVVPYSGSVAGIGTATFQIVLHENGSCQVIFTQLSANWLASTSGATATQGAENLSGSIAIPVPGRNAQDWPGITAGNQDCNTFNPQPCVFQRWEVGGVNVSTNPNFTVSPTTTTTYTAIWDCGGSICTDQVVVTVPQSPPTTSATICAGSSGSLTATCGGAVTTEWYTAPTGGTAIGTGSPFNPVGVAGSGLANTNTAGTTNYYAACSNAPSCRTLTPFVINPGSTPPTSIGGTGTICQGQTVTLSVVGGTLAPGASWQWYTGSCGGTLVGTGNTISVSPTTTTTYFVRASAGTTCPASVCTSGTLTLPPAGTNLGNNTESATCLVNQAGIIYFYHSSGRLICSINSNGQNLGNVTATVYTGTPVDVPACNVAGYMATAMGRSWVITPQFQPAAGVDVYLHFDQTEYTALQTQANANISPYDDLTGIGDLKLSKYPGPLNVDNNALNNCIASGGNGNTTLHNQAASGNTTTFLPAFSGTSRYSRHTIPSFSEFWLHGASTFSALPVELVSFSAACSDENELEFYWSTQSENNCVAYQIEYINENETDWKTLGTVDCEGNLSQLTEYSFKTNDLKSFEKRYYRLKQIDINGYATVYNPIAFVCSSNEWNVISYPNPASTLMNFVITNGSEQEATLSVKDNSGKLIYSIVLNLKKGQTISPLDVENYANGIYFVEIEKENNQKEIIKIVVSH